jgi:GNAT superfamily N-acetyltransferase
MRETERGGEPLHITVEPDPPPEARHVVEDGLLAFNVDVIGDPRAASVGVFVRGDDGAVIGGLLGRIRWEWLYVEKFWLPESRRRQGLGSRLLREAEAFALERGCRGCYLDTFEYQALPFYRKLGYELFGTLDDYPPGYRQLYLRKRLRDTPP